MSWKARVTGWKRQLFGRAGLENELDAELQAYVDLLTEDYIRSGMTLEEARRAAGRDVASKAAVKEQCRDVRAFRWLDHLKQDLRYGLRQIGGNPLLSTAVVLTLALGIGANVIVFSVVRAVVLRPLAYDRPAQLVQVWQSKLRSGAELTGYHSRFQRLESREPGLPEYGCLSLYAVRVDWRSGSGVDSRTRSDRPVVRGARSAADVRQDVSPG